MFGGKGTAGLSYKLDLNANDGDSEKTEWEEMKGQYDAVIGGTPGKDVELAFNEAIHFAWRRLDNELN